MMQLFLFVLLALVFLASIYVFCGLGRGWKAARWTLSVPART